MTVGIMQPYFMPYIGYFQLIQAVDKFVVYDNIEYTKKGWINRNKILLNGEEKKFSIPLKSDSDFLQIKERNLADNSLKMRRKVLSQIENSYRKAKCFESVYPVIEDVFLSEESNLFEFLFNSLKRICDYLDIETEFVISSKIEINHSLKSQEKVLSICKSLDCDRYINAIGGKELYDKEVFKNENIELLFIETKSNKIKYKQFVDKEFIPYLSVIDVMMFNDKSEIKQMLNQFELV